MEDSKNDRIKDVEEVLELCRKGGTRAEILAIGMAMGAKGLQELDKALSNQGA